MKRPVGILVVLLGLAAMAAVPAHAAVIYNNLTPNNLMGMATRPDAPGVAEIETGDDFFVTTRSSIDSASFTGLVVPGTGGTPAVSEVAIEIYRVFPLDSDTTRVIHVPTRANSPSDNALDDRDSATAGLNFTTAVLGATFTVLNTVQPGGMQASSITRCQACWGSAPSSGGVSSTAAVA